MNYAKGMVYARHTTYRLNSGEWITTGFTFNTDIGEIIPSAALFRN